MSTPDSKPLDWVRFAVTVESPNPSATYEKIKIELSTSERFKMTAIGTTTTQVRLVVEYAARGANGDDVKRRLGKLGIDRADVSVMKAASFNADLPFNDDLVRYVGLATLRAAEDDDEATSAA